MLTSGYEKNLQSVWACCPAKNEFQLRGDISTVFSEGGEVTKVTELILDNDMNNISHHTSDGRKMKSMSSLSIMNDIQKIIDMKYSYFHFN
jgi:hypothetical protein